MAMMSGAVLSAAHCHLSDAKSRSGGGAAKFQVRSYVFEILQHIRQIAGDGHFRDGEAELAIANPKAGRAARVIAGNDVHPEADQLGDVEAVRDGADDLLWRFRARLHKQVAV